MIVISFFDDDDDDDDDDNDDERVAGSFFTLACFISISTVLNISSMFGERIREIIDFTIYIVTSWLLDQYLNVA